MRFKEWLINEGTLEVGAVNKNVYVFDNDDDKKGLEKLAKKVDKRAKISTGRGSYIWFPTADKAEEFFARFKEKLGMKLS